MKARPTLFTCAWLAFAALASAPAQAQHIKPGLWEMTSTIGPGNGPTQKDLNEMVRRLQASLPAEARKEQAAQAARTHLRITDTATTGQVCITAAQAAQRERLFQVDERGKCSTRIAPKVGATIKFSFSCTEPQSRGDGSVTFDGSTGFTHQVRATSKNVLGGRATSIRSSMRTRARWLGAACGSVAPQTDPR
jgi:hypothetical protein